MLRAPTPQAIETADAVSLTQTLTMLEGLDEAVLRTTCPTELRRRWLEVLAGVLDLALVVEIGEGTELLDHAAGSLHPEAVRRYLERLDRKGLPGRIASRVADRSSMIAPSNDSVSVSVCDTVFDPREWSPFGMPLREAGLRDPVFASARRGGSVFLLHRRVDRLPLSPTDANLVRLFVCEVARRAKCIELPTAARAEELTPRLRVTLGWLLRGASEKEIACHLGLSVHTVHQYVKSLYRTLGVTSRPQLMARCLRS
jgi:DNA-binding CsgD family transcriptional regulator